MKSLLQIIVVLGLVFTLGCSKENKTETKIRATLLSVTLNEAEDFALGNGTNSDPYFELKNANQEIIYTGEFYENVQLPVIWDDVDVLLNDPTNLYQFVFSDANTNISGNRPFALANLTIEDIYPETEVELIRGSTVVTVELFYR